MERYLFTIPFCFYFYIFESYNFIFKISFFTDLFFFLVSMRTIFEEKVKRIQSQNFLLTLVRITTNAVQRIVKFKFWIFPILFLFVNTGPHGSKSFKWHVLWKYTSESLPKIYTCQVRRVSIKVVRGIWNFKYYIFDIFLFLFRTF